MRVTISEQDLKDILNGETGSELQKKVMNILKIGIAGCMKTGLGKGDKWKDYSGEAYLYLVKQAERLVTKISDYTDEARGSSLVLAVIHGMMNEQMYRSDEAVARRMHKNGISHYSECTDFQYDDDIEDTGHSVWDSMYEVNQLPKDRQRRETLLKRFNKPAESRGEPLF